MEPSEALKIIATGLPSVLLIGGVVSLTAYVSIAKKYRGRHRVLVGLGWYIVFMMATLIVLGLKKGWTAQPRDLDSVVVFAGSLGLIAATVWRAAVVRWSTPPSPRIPFRWLDYLAIAGALVLFHSMLARLAHFLTSDAPEYQTWMLRWGYAATVWAFMFLYAQALSTWVIRCLVNSFDEDWEWRDGSSVPRKLQFPLIMIPLVVLR